MKSIYLIGTEWEKETGMKSIYLHGTEWEKWKLPTGACVIGIAPIMAHYGQTLHDVQRLYAAHYGQTLQSSTTTLRSQF